MRIADGNPLESPCSGAHHENSEMKIWHGESRHKDGEKQIAGYLDHFGLKTGYMLSFSFNKNKKPGVREVHIGDRILYEGIV